jgi:hypothetical protein
MNESLLTSSSLTRMLGSRISISDSRLDHGGHIDSHHLGRTLTIQIYSGRQYGYSRAMRLRDFSLSKYEKCNKKYHLDYLRWYFLFLFPSEICRNLAPYLGFPLEYGVFVFIGFEPENSSIDEYEEFHIFRSSWLLSSRIASLDPGECRDTICVDRESELMFLAVSECMDETQKLDDIVRSVSVGSSSEYLCLCIMCHYSLIFTPSTDCIPGTIYRYTLHIGSSIFLFLLGCRCSWLRSCTDIFRCRSSECHLAFFMARE